MDAFNVDNVAVRDLRFVNESLIAFFVNCLILFKIAKPAMETKQVREIKVFLASSNENFDERVQFGDFVSGLNNMFSSVNIQFLLHKWEYFSFDLAPKDKQEEYNDKVRESEISIVLFWRKIGWFTQRELNAALEAQRANPQTKRVFVFLKAIDEHTEISPENLQKLKDFKDHFYERCQNWPTEIHNNDEFKLSVLQNLIIYLNEGGAGISPFSATEGIIDIGGKTSINLQNVPFIGNNDEYQLLCENIEMLEDKLKTFKPEDIRYSECAERLRKQKKKRDTMENGLLKTALTISKLKKTRCSERLKQAIELFEKGDSRGAKAILDIEAITKDVQAYKNLIKVGNEFVNEGREGLKTNLNEYLMRIDLLTDEMTEGWIDEVKSLFDKCFEIGDDNLEKETFADLLDQYCLFSNTIGNHNQAMEFGTKALDIRLSIFGENHLAVANSYNSIGLTYGYLGDQKNALKYLLKALDIKRSSFGENHPSVAISYNNAGSTYGELSNHKMALEYLLKALDIQRSLFGENHPNVAASYANLGTTYEQMGNNKKALEYMMKALGIQRCIFGENQPDVATSYNNVGSLLGKMGNHKKAFQCLLKALAIRRSLFGEIHSDVAASYNNLGSEYRDVGDYKKALQYLLKALDILRPLFGDNHPDVATSYNNVGSIFGVMGNHKKALEFKLKALDIMRSFFGENHENVAALYNNVGIAYRRLGEYNKAIEYQLKALDIMRSVFGENHQSVADFYINAGNTYQIMGINELASKCFFKANVILQALKKRDEDS